MPHIHSLIDFAVEVFIVHEDKVLLRRHDKYKIWLSVGGHIELNEDPNQAALREVKEEVGLDIKLDESLKPTYQKGDTLELIPPYFLNRHRIEPNHEHVVLVYFATSSTDKILQPTKGEQSEECRWFSKKEIEQSEDIIPNVKFYAIKALEKLAN
ncbi:MAG TPA: NUDIX domain-containing protein [Patescibacteria group bacterium]|nr:NUDIX domain-containing protein [Patescibacteria group bacterium]